MPCILSVGNIPEYCDTVDGEEKVISHPEYNCSRSSGFLEGQYNIYYMWGNIIMRSYPQFTIWMKC